MSVVARGIAWVNVKEDSATAARRQISGRSGLWVGTGPLCGRPVVRGPRMFPVACHSTGPISPVMHCVYSTVLTLIF